MKLLRLAVILYPLAACVSPQQTAQRAEAICTGAGWVKGTAQFEGCMMRSAAAIDERESSVGPAIGAGLQTYGAAIQSAPRPIYSPPAYQPPRQCTTYRNGTMINTTCY